MHHQYSEPDQPQPRQTVKAFAISVIRWIAIFIGLTLAAAVYFVVLDTIAQRVRW